MIAEPVLRLRFHMSGAEPPPEVRLVAHRGTLFVRDLARRLIDTSMLTAEEYAWLEIYHAKCAEALVPLVGPETRPWLDAATGPLGQA